MNPDTTTISMDPTVADRPAKDTSPSTESIADNKITRILDSDHGNYPLNAPTKDKIRDVTDATLKFLSNASNETIRACMIGLGATTYFLLGRVGLVLIGAVGGVILHATWESGSGQSRSGTTERRREAGSEVAKRVLEWQQSRRSNTNEDFKTSQKVEGSTISEELDYSGFQPETALALTTLTNAVIRDYVKYGRNECCQVLADILQMVVHTSTTH